MWQSPHRFLGPPQSRSPPRRENACVSFFPQVEELFGRQLEFKIVSASFDGDHPGSILWMQGSSGYTTRLARLCINGVLQNRFGDRLAALLHSRDRYLRMG